MISEHPASCGQRLLWSLARHRGEATLNCPVVCRIDGPLEIARVRTAAAAVVSRHAALRTTVKKRGRSLRQLVTDESPLTFDHVDLSDARDPREAAEAALDAELRRPIAIDGFPVRATLWTLEPYRHVLCFNVHHLASDGWSGAIQMRELCSLYTDPSGARLPAPSVQYPEFTAREDAYLRDETFWLDREYWQRLLDGASFDCVPLRPRTTGLQSRTSRRKLELDPRRTLALQRLASSSRSTLFNVLVSLYFATLSRMTGREDVTVASLFANRLSPDLRDTVGFLANLVVLRVAVQRRQPFAIVQRTVQSHLRDAFLHQRCSFHLLNTAQGASAGRRGDDTVFQMLPQPLNRYSMGSAAVTMVTPDGIESRFDFEITVASEGVQLAVIVFWNALRLDEAWVASFLKEYRATVDIALSTPDGIV